MDARDCRGRGIQVGGDPRVGEIGLRVDEARGRAAGALLLFENDGAGARARELRAIERIREERDRVGAGTAERADAGYDSSGIAVQLTTEPVRELAQGRGHRASGVASRARGRAARARPARAAPGWFSAAITAAVMSTALLK